MLTSTSPAADAATAVASPPVVLARDFAYPSTDERHAATFTATFSFPPSRRSSGFGTGSPRWSGFAARFGWGSRNNSGDRLSQSRLSSQDADTPTFSDALATTPTQRSTPGTVAGASYDESPEAEDASEEDDDESDVYDDSFSEPLGELIPGLYRALYPFVAEGAAEMDLTEDQLVNVLGRGGGEGWVVVAAESGRQALVPESYLDFVVPFSPTSEEGASERILNMPADLGEESDINERSTTPHA